MKILFLFAVALLMIQCGTDRSDRRLPGLPDASSRELNPYLGVTVRARSEVIIGGEPTAEESGIPLEGRSEFPVSSTVAENVQFRVDGSDLVAPDGPHSGVMSFGELKVTHLIDNNLNVCGPNGNTRCTRALMRIFTTGQKGPGLWNEEAGIGLPMTVDGNTVGLEADNAYIVQAVALGRRPVLRLVDFVTPPPLVIGVDVDYDLATAGDYETTIVVEYLLQ